MARQMENLEYGRVCKELQTLVGAHFDNVYQIGEKTFRLKIGKADLICTLGLRLHETKYVPKETGEITNIIEYLRSKIRGARLSFLRQAGDDRIVQIGIEGEKGNFVMILEMFGKGNLIFANSDMVIQKAHETRKWKDRDIQVGKTYKGPPSQKLSQAPTLQEMLSEFEKKYAIAVFSKIPLGLLYVREALARAGIGEKKDASELPDEDVQRVLSGIKDIREENSPCVYLDGAGRPVQFSCTKLMEFEKFQRKGMGSLCEAADEYYFANLKEDGKGSARDEKIAKLIERIGIQESQIAHLEEEGRKCAEMGKRIYGNFEAAEAEIRKARIRRERKTFLEV